MFSSKICKIFKNTYFEEHLPTTASIKNLLLVFFQYVFSMFLKTSHKE